MSLKFRIVLATACAALAVLACSSYADGVREDAERVRSEAIARYGGEVVSLVVASGPLEAGDVVASSDVIVRDWLADLAPEGAVTSLGDVVGATVTVPAAKGAPLTSLNFRDATEERDVPSGHVALTVPVTDKLGVSREVAVGSTVVAYETYDGGARLLASNLEVLSAPGRTATTAGSSSPMTLAVLPADVSSVLAASTSGDLRLVLPADDVVTLPAGGGQAAPTSVPAEEGKVE